MRTIQKLWEGGGSLMCSINARVVDALELEPGDLIDIDIIRVKKPDERWENVEDEE